MTSTNLVDFSIRPSKAIERALVFEGLAQVVRAENLQHIVYVGFGSVWFVDFLLAHRTLGIETMFSMERDEITCRRAKFNKPYRTVTILEGDSRDELPLLLQEPELSDRPLIVWLDYDRGLGEDRLEELRDLIEKLPPKSFLLTTFSARPGAYGKPAEVRKRLADLFGDWIPETVVNDQKPLRDAKELMFILADAVETMLISTAVSIARIEGFMPLFSLKYSDTSPMVTVGGYLPAGESVEVKSLISEAAWPGRSDQVIVAPPLTFKEIAALEGQLPSQSGISRQTVQELGFDLADEQITSFVTHYLRYPHFARIAR